MDKAWAGVDAGKEFRWAHVLDASRRELLSWKVENDEANIARFIDEALSNEKKDRGITPRPLVAVYYGTVALRAYGPVPSRPAGCAWF